MTTTKQDNRNNIGVIVNDDGTTTVVTPASTAGDMIATLKKFGGRHKGFIFPGVISTEDFTRKVTRNGVTRVYSYTRVVIGAAEAAVPGWELMGVLDIVEGGAVIRTVPGKTLDGWTRPTDYYCDHCHTKRSRKRSFLVKEEATGNIKQVGSTCLKDYTGMTVSTALAVMDLQQSLSDLVEEQGWTEYFDSPRYEVDYILKAGYVLSEKGLHFMTVGRSREMNALSTSDIVNKYVGNDPKFFTSSERNNIADDIANTPKDVIDDMVEFGKKLDGNSDYIDNIKAILNSHLVEFRHIGILLSLIPLYIRESVKRDLAPYSDGYLAEESEKVSDVPVTIDNISFIDGYYGIKTVVTMRDEDNHLIVWFASGRKDLGKGEKFLLRGTVKSHSVYKSTAQTVMTRCKLENAQ